jgi:putative hydrolase of the HAD superfamily
MVEAFLSPEVGELSTLREPFETAKGFPYDRRRQLHPPHRPYGNIHLPYRTTALLFDLDDTLFDREKAFHRWATAFAQAHFPLEKGSSFQEALDLLISLDAHGYTPRKRLFREFQQTYPWLELPAETLVEMFYEQFPRHIECDTQLSQLLHTLQNARIPFGVVTNGSSRQQQKIEVLGLDRLTSCIFISERFGVKKPDASIFLAAASCLQVQAERILFIGDHPVRDIWGAHQVGMRTIWLHRFTEWPSTLSSSCVDMTVHSLEELIICLNHPL